MKCYIHCRIEINSSNPAGTAGLYALKYKFDPKIYNIEIYIFILPLGNFENSMVL